MWKEIEVESKLLAQSLKLSRGGPYCLRKLNRALCTAGDPSHGSQPEPFYPDKAEVLLIPIP